MIEERTDLERNFELPPLLAILWLISLGSCAPFPIPFLSSTRDSVPEIQDIEIDRRFCCPIMPIQTSWLLADGLNPFLEGFLDLGRELGLQRGTEGGRGSALSLGLFCGRLKVRESGTELTASGDAKVLVT